MSQHHALILDVVTMRDVRTHYIVITMSGLVTITAPVVIQVVVQIILGHLIITLQLVVIVTMTHLGHLTLDGVIVVVP
jgi:hypothetical protein